MCQRLKKWWKRRAQVSPHEAGSVTVELAVGFVAVTLMIALIATIAGIGMTRAALCSSVREAARVASLGGDGVAAGQHAYTRSGSRPTITVSRSDRWVSVSGSVPYPMFGGMGAGQASCTATTIVEHDVP